MVRGVCSKKLNAARDLWIDEEDSEKNLDHSCKQGRASWNAIAKKTGLGRCGKSCRLRWSNDVKQDLKNDSFNLQEEEMIIRLHATIGSRWTIIAQQLPGRTDNDVKNYWNSKLRKKLTDMGIDPVTHRPFSQVLADYGSIGGLPKTTNRTASLSKDFKNPFFIEPAVKMVAGASGPAPPSASSSSSSSCSSGFSWRDFLSEDVILQSDNLKEPENGPELPMVLTGNEKSGDGDENHCSGKEKDASMFRHGRSFIEALLDQDDKMFLDFRDLLEEPF